MARGTVNPTLMTLNAGTAGTPTAIDATNFHQLLTTDGLVRRHFVQVINTGGTAGTAAFEPGNYPPAFLAFAGTVGAGGTQLVTIAAGGTAFITLDGAKVIQSDGLSIYLDFYPSTMTGSVTLYELPVNL